MMELQITIPNPYSLLGYLVIIVLDFTSSRPHSSGLLQCIVDLLAHLLEVEGLSAYLG